MDTASISQPGTAMRSNNCLAEEARTACEPLLTPELQMSDIQLSTEQQDVLDRVRAGQSVFFTGSAGTFNHIS
jgi:hypothetical protein